MRCDCRSLRVVERPLGSSSFVGPTIISTALRSALLRCSRSDRRLRLGRVDFLRRTRRVNRSGNSVGSAMQTETPWIEQERDSSIACRSIAIEMSCNRIQDSVFGNQLRHGCGLTSTTQRADGILLPRIVVPHRERPEPPRAEAAVTLAPRQATRLPGQSRAVPASHQV